MDLVVKFLALPNINSEGIPKASIAQSTIDLSLSLSLELLLSTKVEKLKKLLKPASELFALFLYKEVARSLAIYLFYEVKININPCLINTDTYDIIILLVNYSTKVLRKYYSIIKDSV